MIEDLLPAEVAAAESFGEASGDDLGLYPEEWAAIRSAVVGRRREFATGRACARAALAKLGRPPQPILVGDSREPLWPAGIVGSITHCAGFAAAAVADASAFLSIGIDAEPDVPLPEHVLEVVARPGELAQLGMAASPSLDRVLFSAKETTFKAWFPLTHKWLDFGDAEVGVGLDGTFQVRVLVPGPLSSLHGRWLARDALIVTAIAVPHPDVVAARPQP